MSKKTLVAAVILLFTLSPFADAYLINPFPSNYVLGPEGLVPIPQAVQQFIQASGSGFVAGVNDSGQMAITASGPVQGMSAFVYLPTAAYGLSPGITQVSYNPQNMNTSWATGINDAGQIVGSDGDNWRLWNIGGTTSTLGTQTGLAGAALGVNDFGQVIVQDSTSSSSIHIYVWSPVAENGYAQGLTDLVPAGSNYSGSPLGIAINASGDALYRATITSTSTTFQAYLNVGKNHQGLAKGRITLSSTNWSMYQPTGLNDLDEVVGMAAFTTNGSNNNDPALWTLANGAVDLNSLLPQNSDWVLQTVSGIDELGDIKGTGLFNGVSTTFLLSVPEPTAISLGLLGFGLLSPRKRHRPAANRPPQPQ